MAYNSISIKPYTKSHLELQREITPAMTFQDIKETKRYRRTDGRTHARTDGQRENSIPTTNKVCGGINIFGTYQIAWRLGLTGTVVISI